MSAFDLESWLAARRAEVNALLDARLPQAIDDPGRLIEAMHASHPAAISTSGGRLASLTRRLVLAMAHLSNDAIRVASAPTKASSSVSGNDRFT